MNQVLKCCKLKVANVQRFINVRRNHLYEVLLRIITITKMLAKCFLVFEGTIDKLFGYIKGNL